MNSAEYAPVNGLSGVVSTPPGGGGGHLVTVPPGVGGDRHPWGGLYMGGRGYILFSFESLSLCTTADSLSRPFSGELYVFIADFEGAARTTSWKGP